MKVKPLAERRRAKPVAVVLAAGPGSLMVATDDGEVSHARTRERAGHLLRQLDGWQVYTATRPTRLLVSTGSSHWTGYQWRGALVRMKLDGGPMVHPIRRAVDGLPLSRIMPAIMGALSWLNGYGVIPGSLGSMAWRLWRATLPAPVFLSGPRHRHALYGGRQEAPWPGDFSEARYYDLGAAYPHSMAATPYPRRFVRVSPHTALEGACGLARATVAIPEMPWCPLPVRVAPGAVCYGYGTTEGWWTWRELALAREMGCRVDVHESWCGVGDTDLFGPWWQEVKRGRALPGDAAAVVKAVTSSLWGQFAMEPDGGRIVRWRDDYARQPIAVPVSRAHAIPQTQSVYVACETTSRVRERLYREALAVLPDALYCDTDAVIGSFDDAPDPIGLEPGQWRVKATMVRCEIRAPQVLRHLCPTCERDHAPWHYTVAGAATDDLAQRIFGSTKRVNVASLAPGDITLPRANLNRLVA